MMLDISFSAFCPVPLNLVFFFSSRRRHTRCYRDCSSDVCSSDLSVQLLNGDWYYSSFTTTHRFCPILPDSLGKSSKFFQGALPIGTRGNTSPVAQPVLRAWP